MEKVNRVKKHIRRSQKYPQGGVLSKEMPVQLSNLKYFCPSCGKATRLGARFLADGSKERFCRKCETSAGQIAPAKKAHAHKVVSTGRVESRPKQKQSKAKTK